MDKELAPNLNETLKALGSTLLSISNQMDADKRERKQEISTVKQDFNDLRQDVSNEIEGIKDSQYLDPPQAADINDAAHTRVGDLLRDWCNDNNGDMDVVCKKYFGKFVRALHGDARKRGLEIGKVVYTPKRNYETLLEFIGNWYPKRGVEGQMRHYDKLETIS